MNRYLLAAIICLTSTLLPSCDRPPERDAAPGPLAVLGAFKQEVELFETMLIEARSQEIEGITFVSGRHGSRSVVVAWTGVGKVNAAMATTLLIEHFRPAQVVFTGIAGSVDPNLEPGDIVIARQTAHHDMGTLGPEGLEHSGVKDPVTGMPNPVFFPADPVLLAAAEQAAKKAAFNAVSLRTGERPPKVLVGTVVTGDVFVASKQKCAELSEKLGAAAVEMEGAAVAQLCYQRGVGCLIIRSVSDKADESAVSDKQIFYAMAAENSASLVAALLENLGQ